MSNKFSNDFILICGLICMLISTWYLTIKKRLDAQAMTLERERQEALAIAAAAKLKQKIIKPMGRLSLFPHMEDCFWSREYQLRDFLTKLRLIPHNVYMGAERHEQVKISRCRTVSGPSLLDLLPSLPGCEPDGPAAKQMISRFPDTPLPDIIRFLVARKGDVAAASEMMEKAIAWKRENLPLSRTIAEPAVQTKCCFFHGKALDGTPTLYFRGGLYDNTKAPFQSFVLVAAHTIDHVLRDSKQLAVTVVVHLGHVPGGPNASADMNFIKYFAQVLSDNYPERLKRLVMFPFPWYGRAIWSCVKMFVDKRTQDKVLLYPGSAKGVPQEILEFIDIDEIPECCEGNNKEPIVDMMTIFE